MSRIKSPYIVRAGEQLAHAHRVRERAVYILEGEAIAGIDGVDHHVRTGDMMFLPAKVLRSIRVLTKRLRLRVINAPRCGEDPRTVLRAAAAG